MRAYIPFQTRALADLECPLILLHESCLRACHDLSYITEFFPLRTINCCLALLDQTFNFLLKLGSHRDERFDVYT